MSDRTPTGPHMPLGGEKTRDDRKARGAAAPRDDDTPPGDAARRRRRSARILFGLAAVGLVLYLLNIAAGMAAVKLGWKLQRFSDIWEFLTVLVTMVFFVAGLLVTEERRPQEPSAD
jgi:hypothetical protein